LFVSFLIMNTVFLLKRGKDTNNYLIKKGYWEIF